MSSLRGSLKNCGMKGAEMLRVKILLASAACFAICVRLLDLECRRRRDCHKISTDVVVLGCSDCGPDFWFLEVFDFELVGSEEIGDLM
jgi:hypothetical protein